MLTRNYKLQTKIVVSNYQKPTLLCNFFMHIHTSQQLVTITNIVMKTVRDRFGKKSRLVVLPNYRIYNN